MGTQPPASKAERAFVLLIFGAAMTLVFGVVYGVALRDHVAYLPRRRAPTLKIEEAKDAINYSRLIWLYGLLTLGSFLTTVYAAFRLSRPK